MQATAAKYWNVSVSVDGVCKCSCAADTLSGAITKAVRDSIYYQAQYPQASITYDLAESCACCHNEGTIVVPTARTSKRKTCPECKGKIPQAKLDCVRFEMPDTANRIQLLAG